MNATKTLQHALLDNGTMTLPRTDEIHVLVVVPPPRDVGGKRVGVDDWFADEIFCTHKKKQKLGEEDGPDQFTRYFEMADFPPLLHPMLRYEKIVERDAYVVIFAELMSKVKQCFEVPSAANMIVTGNPGIGKSRFYLYCIFQLLFGQRADVKELGSFDLVLNADNIYHQFRAESNQFVELDTEQVRALSQQLCVLRLIDGKSSTLTGWSGVSILFACPDLDGIKNYAKVKSFTYILPVWSLEELEEYNSLLDG